MEYKLEKQSVAQPKVTLAVFGYKNVEMFRLCLQSICEHVDLEQHEVIVADSATEIETVMMMREEFPNFTFIAHKKNVGFGAMVNVALAKARGEYFFVLNSDIVLEPDTVPKLVQFMDRRPSIGICGPAQKNFNGKRENTRFRFYKPQTIIYRRTFLKALPAVQKHLEHFEMADISGNDPYPVPWVLGSALFMRKSMIDQIGGMDPRFFMYMEDVDWCRRFWENGFEVYFHPQITLFHFYGKGSAQGNFLQNVIFNRLTWIHIASACKYFLKYAARPMPDTTGKPPQS